MANRCLAPLDKYDAGCGGHPLPNQLKTWRQRKADFSHGMHRVEVRSQEADSHLGHVFTDGPPKKVAYVIALMRQL